MYKSVELCISILKHLACLKRRKPVSDMNHYLAYLQTSPGALPELTNVFELGRPPSIIPSNFGHPSPHRVTVKWICVKPAQYNS